MGSRAVERELAALFCCAQRRAGIVPIDCFTQQDIGSLTKRGVPIQTMRKRIGQESPQRRMLAAVKPGT